MGAAVVAANSNGCIDEVFEGVNQAIIKGGYKVEFVVGKALALGVAQGVASEGGEVLAKATAVVICRGGASASACAKAWNQAIKIDSKNGCAVLVRAYVHARTYCSEGKAISNVQSTVFKEPYGQCRAQGLYDGNGGRSGGGAGGMYGPQGFAAGSYGPQGAMSVSQGPTGQTVTYPDGTTVTQGPGVSSSVWAHNGGWRKGNRGAATIITQGAGGQRIQWGRWMLLARKDLRVLLSGVRRLQGANQYGYWGNNNNYDVTSNNFARVRNTGYTRGGVTANSQSNSRDSRCGSSSSWCTSRVTSNSAAVATNSGETDGPVVANSVSFADGRH